jgi:hypothetical protein
MSDSASGARAAGDIPPCPPEVCADPQVQAYIAELCKQPGWPPGKPVLVMQPDGKLCACYCGGAPKAAGGEAAPVPACSADLCRELRPTIDQLCRDLGYPPGHKVLVVNPGPGGGYCYCTCGGG